MMLCRKKLLYQNIELIGLVGGVREALLFTRLDVENLSFQVWRFSSRLCVLEVRNGVRMFFWHDTWCGDQPLKVHFLIFLGWLV